MDVSQIMPLLSQLKEGVGGNQEVMLLLSGLNRNIGDLNGFLESANSAYRQLQSAPQKSSKKKSK